MLDKVEEARDRRLARHIVSLYAADASETVAAHGFIEPHVLRDYISYARVIIPIRTTVNVL